MRGLVTPFIIAAFLFSAFCAVAENAPGDVTAGAADPDEAETVIEVKRAGKIKGQKAESVGRGIEARGGRQGVHFRRRYHMTFYSTDSHHELPTKYLITVPPSEKREGLPENMMIGLYSNFRSTYVSKELPDSKGPVWQPSATVEAYGFGLNVWANFVLNDEPNQGEFNEVDFTTYYTAHIGHLTIHPYALFMVFPNADPASLDYASEPIIETNLFLEYIIWQFNIFSLTRTQVMGTTPGAVYSHIGVGFKQPFDCGITFETSALMSFGNDRFLTSHYGRMDMNIDTLSFMLGASWNPWKGLTFNPNVNVAIHVVPEIRRAIRQNPDLETYIVWGGLDLAYNF